MEERLLEANELINELMSDATIPKNVRSLMVSVSEVLSEGCELSVKCDKAIQLLTINDQSIDMFTKTRIWSLLSMLESIS